MKRTVWCLALLGAAACGGKGAQSGYMSACDTASSGILDCPLSTQATTIGDSSSRDVAVRDACQKLVDCNILAGKRLSGTSHSLDYSWCVNGLSEVGAQAVECNGGGDRFGLEDLDVALECIAATPCAALGLTLNEKITGKDQNNMDVYRCVDNSTVKTATVCDHGLLNY